MANALSEASNKSGAASIKKIADRGQEEPRNSQAKKTESLPREPERLIELGRRAEHQRNWLEAEQCWRALLSQDQTLWWAHTALAIALREQQRYGEADAVLAESRVQCPNEPGILAEYARLSEAQGEWPEALRRWTKMQSHFPEVCAGYLGEAATLRKLDRTEDARNVLVAALQHFPKERALFQELGRLAEHRRDWPEAEGYWRSLLSLDDQQWWVHGALVTALCEQKRYDDARQYLETQIQVNPNVVELWVQRARLASLVEAPDAARQKWQEICLHFPDNPAGFVGQVQFEFHNNDFITARLYCDRHAKTFPNDFSLNLFKAKLCQIFGENTECLRILNELIEKHPNNQDLYVIKNDTIGRINQGSIATSQSSDSDNEENSIELASEDREFYLQFESLGANCEFGFVQRRHGAEPIGLLRWSSITPKQLSYALDNKFDGLGDDEYLEIVQGWNYQWDARDSRYFTYHTYIGILEAGKPEATEIVRKRLNFMRKKLVRDLEEGEKIFVYKKWNFRLTDSEIDAISRSLRNINKNNKLLVVKLFDDQHQPGEVFIYNDNVVIGFLEVDAVSASLEHVPIESWRKLCRATWEIFSSKMSSADIVNAKLAKRYATRTETPPIEQQKEETDLLHQIGRQAERQRNWSEAADAWRKFIALDPDRWWVYTALAGALREQRLWDEADAALIAGQARCPAEQALFFDYAKLAEMRQDWAEAGRRWDLARTSFPDHWASYTGKATVLRELGQFSAAEQLMAEAVARFPDNTGLLHDLGRLAERGRNWPEAERAWRQLIALDADKWWAYTALAAALREQQRWDDADAALVDGQSRCPDDLPVYVDYARLAEMREDWAETLRRWELVAARFPDHSVSYTGRASALRELGRIEDSEQVIAAAVARFPENTDLLHDLGRLAERRRNWAEAADIWRRYIALDAGKWWTYTALAGALREQQLWDEADAALSAGQARCPNDQPPFFDYARFAEIRQNWAEALERWALVRAHFPEHWASYIGNARALSELGRVGESESAIADAVQRFPGNAGLLHDLGRLAERQRNWVEAERIWRQYIGLDGDKWWAYSALAAALREQSKWDEADAVLVDGQGRVPGEPAVFFEYARTAEIKRDWAESLKRWEIARARFPGNWMGYAGAARALSELNRHGEADSLLAECLTRFPNEPNLLSDYARLAGQRSDWSEALRRWQLVQARLPSQYAGYRGAAAALQELDRTEEAAQVLSAAAEKFPNDGDPIHDLARLAERRRDWEMAAQYWAELRGKFPENPSNYLSSARALFEASRTDDVEHVIAEARKRFPDDSAVFYTWADFATRRDLWAIAIGRWEEFRDRFPDDPIGYVRAAQTYYRWGRNPEADAIIDEGKNRLPNSIEIAVCRAEITALRRNWLESARQWEDVRRQYPTFSRAYIEEARLRSEAEDKPAALALLDAARRALPDDATIAFAWLRLVATSAPQREVLDKWQEVQSAFSHLADCYIVGGEALRQAGLGEDCEATLAAGLKKFPASAELARLWAEAGYLTDEPDAAAKRYSSLLPQFEADHRFVLGALRAFAASERKDDFDAANAAALQRWPHDYELLNIRAQFMLQRDDADGTFATWTAIRDDFRIRFDLKTHFATEILKAYPQDVRSNSAIDFLLREPDVGTQEWRPAISRAFPHGDPRDRTTLIRAFLSTASQEEFTLPCLLALKTAADIDLTESDISAGIAASADRGRLLLLVSIFRSSYFLEKNHPDRLRKLVAVLKADWLKRAGSLKLTDASDYRDVLGYLLLAFAYDVSVFHLIADQVQKILGKRLKSPPSTISRVEDVVGNIVASITARKKARKNTESRARRTGRRLKIAVCVSGQMRGFREAVPTWSNLGLDEHDAHYFVHTWQDVGLNWRRTLSLDGNNPVFRRTIHSALGREILMTKYPHLYAAMRQLEDEAKSIDPEELKSTFGTNQIAIENDQVPPYLGRSNLWKMYYKIEQAQKMAEASNLDFDLFIRIRPDIMIHESSAIDWRAVRDASERDQVVFTEFGTILQNPTSDFPLVGDKFYAGTGQMMKVISGAHSFANKINEESKYLDMPSGYHPHVTLAFTAFYNGVAIQTVPGLVCGSLVNAAPLDPRKAVEAVKLDVADRELDEVDLNLLGELERQAGDMQRREQLKQAAE